jgi:hypothetical protein
VERTRIGQPYWRVRHSKVRRLDTVRSEAIALTGGMDRETFNVIAKVLHSDKRPTEVDRGEACKACSWRGKTTRTRRNAEPARLRRRPRRAATETGPPYALAGLGASRPMSADAQGA